MKLVKSSGQLIIRKIVALFGLLILVIIINAVYSMIHENRNLNRQIAANLNSKLEIAASVQRNELEKLRMISVSIKEQSGKFADYLDYDNVVPITMILKNITHLYPEDIDFIFLFDEYEELLTSNITGTDIEDTEVYHTLIKNPQERTGIEELSPGIFQEQLAELEPLSGSGNILCFKALSQILHDTGDIYCYVVVIKLINDNKKLIQKMTETSRAAATYYDKDGNSVISGFSSLNVPCPSDGTLVYQGKSFFTAEKEIRNYAGEPVGKLLIAIDKKPFSDSKKRLLLSRILPFFASTGISVLLFLLLKVRVFNKIGQLIRVQRMVADGSGHLGIRLKLPENKDWHSLDEVEQMGADFNLMMDKLEETHTKVQEANRYIMESLGYAKRIQSSILPNPEEVRQFLPDSFVIWMPRDVVGGDIFLIEQVPAGFLAAVIDCTGHGVPGAFLTMIASSALRRIIRDEACHEPVQILKRLNFIVKTTLRQDTEYGLSDDGMDVALCVVNSEERMLNFAGAGLSLFYSRGRKIHRIKGDRQSIGYKQSKRTDIHFDFTPHAIPLQEGMRFYMASDGFEDQMGLDEQGQKLKRFGKRRFAELLREISELPFETQQDKLVEVFETHKGDEKSQDDVTVVGFGF